MSERLLLLGSEGFLGAAFCDQPQFAGINIITADRAPSRLGLVHKQIDLSDREKVLALVDDVQPNYIVNLAGCTNGTTEELIQSNFTNSHHLLHAALRLRSKLRRVILIGSAAEYGKDAPVPTVENQPLNATSNYGLSKVLQTNLAQYYERSEGLPIVILRLFNPIGVYNPANSFLASLIRRIQDATSHVAVRNLESRRDFIDVRDVVSAIEIFLTAGRTGEVYNIGRGEMISVGQISERAIKASNRPLKLISETTTDEIRHSCASVQKVFAETAWRPKFDPLQTVDAAVKAAKISSAHDGTNC
jgi:GDP-4-dehydro-6-deoxy-D-mannose reductase